MQVVFYVYNIIFYLSTFKCMKNKIVLVICLVHNIFIQYTRCKEFLTKTDLNFKIVLPQKRGGGNGVFLYSQISCFRYLRQCEFRFKMYY